MSPDFRHNLEDIPPELARCSGNFGKVFGLSELKFSSLKNGERYTNANSGVERLCDINEDDLA